jgi:hypothetical protein
MWFMLAALALATSPVLGEPAGRVATAAAAGATRPRPSPIAQALVASVDARRFRADLRALSQFGDRAFGTARNRRAARWIRRELARAGYPAQMHRFRARGRIGRSVYATKVGSVSPHRMLIVSAHFDGRGRGSATDDNASGVALVLAAARLLAPDWVRTDISIRFMLWDGEEVDLAGSRAYVRRRERLQRRPGAGVPRREPRWVGVIQHDMILYDHGLPPGRRQAREADIDIEYLGGSARSGASRALARSLARGNRWHAVRFPAEVGGRLSNTDAVPFAPITAAVSVRENRRRAEIGRGSNPHWHRRSDRPGAYRAADLAFGLDVVRTSVGTVAQLAGTEVDTTRLVDPVVRVAGRVIAGLRAVLERAFGLFRKDPASA